MKKIELSIFVFFITIFVCFFSSIVFATENEIAEEIVDENIVEEEILSSSSTSFSAYIEIDGYKINTWLSNNIYYLFVPNNVDITNLEINYENKQVVNDFSHNNTLQVVASNNKQYTIKVMKSDIPSICINLKNNVELETVHAGSKDIKYGASMQIIGANDENYNILDNNIEIKGRGNSTWKYEKKPYQIKLNKKQNLFGIGKGKAKKWILLANQFDRSLLRNKIANDISTGIGLSDIPNSKFIDLYINGEFLGNYLLTEKIEVGASRVALKDEKGVLVEMDNLTGTSEELYFKSKYQNIIYTLKDSYADDNDLGDDAKKVAFKSFENSINNFEKLLYSENASWDKIKNVIDVESFAKLYLITELSEDIDAFATSMFFYKDGDNDKIHAGPAWDFDVALGYHKVTVNGGNTNVDYILDYRNSYYNKLMEYNQFINLVNTIYNNKAKVEFVSATQKINEYTNNMENSIKMNFTKWNDLLGNTKERPSTSANGNTQKAEANYLKNWMTKRINYMNERYKVSNVIYKTHVQDYGWTSAKMDGQLSGTSGESKRLESIKISLPTDSDLKHISYQVHIQDIGWQNWVSDGKLAGTEGQGKRLEGIRIVLTGMPEYSVMYRVHVQDIGWQEWKANGEMAGTSGLSKRLEAIEIKIVKTNSLGNVNQSQTAKINYSAHIQNIGWSGWGCDGEIIGTEGISARLEGIKININNQLVTNTNIKYQVHVQDYGWQNWKNSGELAGTSGESKRLEAIRIKLDNPNYKVRYRTHIQDIGWRTLG